MFSAAHPSSKEWLIDYEHEWIIRGAANLILGSRRSRGALVYTAIMMQPGIRTGGAFEIAATLADIAEVTMYSTHTVSLALADLRRAGLLRSRRDGRALVITLTPGAEWYGAVQRVTREFKQAHRRLQLV